MMTNGYALEMRGVTKTFPGVQALKDVNFAVRKGEVHALVGENGAGKSTLIKVLAGAQTADAGEILLDGTPAHIASPLEAQRLGVSIIYQEFNLVPDLNVAENIFLGREPTKGPLGWIDRRKMCADADAILQRLGIPLDVRAPVRRLSVAHQQIVEIAKALSQQATIVAMDEPSATLTEHELNRLFEVIQGLKKSGVSIIYISHRLEEIFGVCDSVTVLRDGQLVGTLPTNQVNREQLISMMVGRELEEGKFVVRKPPRKAPILSVKNLNRRGVLHDINFELYRGEILAFTGLVGAGRTELARAIFGADAMDSGEIYLHGQRVHVKSPQHAVKIGIGYLPEDRKQLGLVLGMVVRENATLSNLGALSVLGFVRRGAERAVVGNYVRDLDVRTPSIEQLVRNLSGGNQQKVVLAKWLFADCKVLIFDEPTRGVDVGAKAEIHRLMVDLAERGVGVMMISSELPEVLQVADRILVMHEGRIAAEMFRDEATQESIMHYATGGT
jgi:ribose transport system ATP-binding protein